MLPQISPFVIVAKKGLLVKLNFKTPLFVFMETRTHFKLNQLPERFDLDNKYHQILCSILYIKQKKHFVSVFFLCGHKYLVDDLKPNQSKLLEENNQTHRNFFKCNISSALYYIVDWHFLKAKKIKTIKIIK